MSFSKRAGWPVGFEVLKIVKSALLRLVNWSPITTISSAKGNAQREKTKLRVQRYTSQSRIGQGQIRLIKDGSRAKSYNEVWPRVDCKQSPVMMFVQGWIANKVLQWCLPKGRLQAKSCNDVCSKVDCKQSYANTQRQIQRQFAQRQIALKQIQKQFVQEQFRELQTGNCEGRTAKRKLQMVNCKRGTVLITKDRNSQI